MWPCCDDTSSDDDEHNTGNTLLLLFADDFIAPALLAGLSEVDVLYIALGCRFALDIFTTAQQDRPSPEPNPLPLEPCLQLQRSSGQNLILQTAVLDLRLCGYTVTTADTLRSVYTALQSALSDCRFSPHHTFTFASVLLW